MQWQGCVAALAIGLALSACANLQTVGRNTPLSGTSTTIGYDKDGNKTGSTTESSVGLAVHLDAQQRAIIQAGARYCAEPSPDAMAAYAASLGLGASVPGTSAGSASNALSSAAVNIGLRTQSIQLMRDALYRLCEAGNNDLITKSDVAMLLRRSQDLTAVVVAVEQLTGAVVAQQAIVNASARASAFASLVADQQLLAEMEDQVTKRKTAVEEAQSTVNTATAHRNEAVTAKEQADATLAQTNNADNQKAVDDAQEDLNNKRGILNDRQRDLDNREQQLAYAERVRDKIKSSLESALTGSSTSTSTSAQFAQARQQIILGEAASIKIAEVVGGMVKDVLQKDYTVDHCMTLLASTNNANNVAAQICKEIMTRSATEAFRKQFVGVDEASHTLNCLLDAGKVTERQITDWLKNKEIKLDNVQMRLQETQEAQTLRRSFVNELPTGINTCGLS